MTQAATAGLSKRGQSASAPVAVAVVIVNYRTAPLAVAAAQSTLEELERLGGVVVIIDNHSDDGSAEILARFRDDSPHRERITIVCAERNDGFAAGVNCGLNAVDAECYLLLNSDAAAETGAIGEMLAALRANRQAGLVTPTVASSAGALQSSRFRRLTPLSEFLDGAQTGFLSRLFPGAVVAIPPDDWETAPAWVSFAAVLLKAEAVAAVGPIDEDYFLYFEDCDYCRRLRRAGLQIAFSPRARFRHDEGGSTRFKKAAVEGARLPAYYYRARNRYFRSYFGPVGPLAANLAWTLGRAIASMRAVFGKPAPSASRGRLRDQWNGWLAGGRDSPKK